MEAWKQWNDIFKFATTNRILYPAKLSLKNEGEIKTFPDNQRVIIFITNRFTLKEILRMFLKLHINDMRWKPGYMGRNEKQQRRKYLSKSKMSNWTKQ